MKFFKRHQPLTPPVGTPGTAIFGGYVESREKAQSLQGTQRYATYQEVLLNIDIVAAGVRYYLNLIGGADWSARPADTNSAESVALAQKTEEILRSTDRSWSSIVRRTSMYRFYGFSVQEWTASRMEDGTFGLFSISPRPQHTIEQWKVDEFGAPTVAYQRSPQNGNLLALPREKLVYIVDDSIIDGPEGCGLLRQLVPHANILQTYEKLEGVGFETDLRGIPVARAPVALLAEAVKLGRISATAAEAALNDMRTFIENHFRGPKSGMLLDSAVYTTSDDRNSPSTQRLWDMELLRGESSALEDLGAAIDRKTRGVAKIMGVEHLLLGENGTGSYAQSKDKTSSFFLSANTVLEEIAVTYRRDLLVPLWALNGWDPMLMPTLVFEPIQFKDVDVVTKAIVDMAHAGAILDPEDPIINEVRDLIGAPRVEE